jgi:hypothetical protein
MCSHNAPKAAEGPMSARLPGVPDRSDRQIEGPPQVLGFEEDVG